MYDTRATAVPSAPRAATLLQRVRDLESHEDGHESVHAGPLDGRLTQIEKRLTEIEEVLGLGPKDVHA